MTNLSSYEILLAASSLATDIIAVAAVTTFAILDPPEGIGLWVRELCRLEDPLSSQSPEWPSPSSRGLFPFHR